MDAFFIESFVICDPTLFPSRIYSPFWSLWAKNCSKYSYLPSLRHIGLNISDGSADDSNQQTHLHDIEALLAKVLFQAPNINSVSLTGFVSPTLVNKVTHISALRCFELSDVYDIDDSPRLDFCQVIDQLAALEALDRLCLPPLLDLDIPSTTGFRSLRSLDISAQPGVVVQFLNTISTHNQLRKVKFKMDEDAEYIPESYRSCLDTLSALSGATLRHVNIIGPRAVEKDGPLVKTLKPLLLLDQLLSIEIDFRETSISIEEFLLLTSAWPRLQDLKLRPELRIGSSHDACSALVAFPYACPALQKLYLRLSGDILSDRIDWKISAHDLKGVVFVISDMKRPVDMLRLISCIFLGANSVVLLVDGGSVHSHYHYMVHDLSDDEYEGGSEEESDGEEDTGEETEGEEEGSNYSEEDGDHSKASDDEEGSSSEEESTDDQTSDGGAGIDDELQGLRDEEERQAIITDMEGLNGANDDEEQSRMDVRRSLWALLQMPQLRSLLIDIPGLHVDVKDVHTITTACPNLEELKLTSPVSQGFPSESGFITLVSLARLCPKLLDVTIETRNWTQPSVTNWPPLTHGLKLLSLHLETSWSSRPLNLIAYLSLLFPKMRRIAFEDTEHPVPEQCPSLHPDYSSGICYLLQQLAQLSRLSIDLGGRAISSSDIKKMATSCPNLEVLYTDLTVVQDSTEINDSGFLTLFHLACSCPALRILEIGIADKYLPDLSHWTRMKHPLEELQLRAEHIKDCRHLVKLLKRIFPTLYKTIVVGPKRSKGVDASHSA